MNRIEANFIFNRPNPGFNPSNQFPGTQFGGTIEQVRNLIRHQKKEKGFPLANAVGVNTFTLQLSGDARLLLGFKLFTATANDTIRLKINEEIVIDNTPASHFAGVSLTGRPRQDEYHLFPRPLSGQDEIILTYTAIAAVANAINLIYL